MGLFDLFSNINNKKSSKTKPLQHGAAWTDKNVVSQFKSSVLQEILFLPTVKSLFDWESIQTQQPTLYGIQNLIANSCAATPYQIMSPTKGVGTKTKHGKIKGLVCRNFTNRSKIEQFSSPDWVGVLGSTNKNLTGQPIENHPVIALLQTPNSEMTGFQMHRLMQTHIDTVGEAFAVIERDNKNEPVELWPVPPHFVERFPSFQIPYFLVRVMGVAYYIPKEDVLFFRTLDPSNIYWRGRGPAQAANDEIAASEYAAKWNARRFYNDCRPGIALMVDGNVNSQEDADAIREKFDGRQGGFLNAFKTMVVGGRIKEIKELGQNVKDMDFPKLMNWSRDSMLMSYGLSGSMIGVTEHVNKSNAETSYAIFSTNVLLPKLICWQDVITIQLLSQYKRFKGCWMEFESPVPEDKEAEKADGLKAFQFGALTRNEIRTILGQPPAEGKDGETYIVPITSMAVPVGQGQILPAQANTGQAGSSSSDSNQTQNSNDKNTTTSSLTTSSPLDEDANQKKPKAKYGDETKVPPGEGNVTTAPDGEMPTPPKPKKDYIQINGYHENGFNNSEYISELVTSELDVWVQEIEKLVN